MAPVLAWHFVGDTLRDGRPIPPDGATLHHDGPLELCASGLHASERVIDALNYAPGATLCRVECSGTVVRGADKLVATERTILWRIDARAVLREFAQRCALEAAQLWDMPAVVRRYLETGDNALRAAAEAAAWAAEAAWAAAEAAARAAARAAAWSAQNETLTRMVLAQREGAA